MVMPRLELKISGWRLAWKTSSWRVSAQWPSPGSASRTNDGCHEIGSSRRRVAKAPSRRSSSCAQNSHSPRLISDSGTSGGTTPLTRVEIPTPHHLIVEKRDEAEPNHYPVAALLPAVMASGLGLVPDAAVGSALLLHFRLEHVPLAPLELVADPALVVAELGPVAVIEFLHDLERPAAVQNVAADEFGLQPVGRSAMPGGPQLVARFAEHEIGVPDQLVERVEVPTGAFDVLEGLRHLPDRLDRGVVDTRWPSSQRVIGVARHRRVIPRRWAPQPWRTLRFVFR